VYTLSSTPAGDDAPAGNHIDTTDHTDPTVGDLIDLEELDWWRRPCAVTDTILLSGDLPVPEADALRQLQVWLRSGVGIIVDCREEYSDEQFVALHAPEVTYIHVGTHDAGGAQDPEWFSTTVRRLREAQAASDAKVVIHCHMGVNRAPSMTLAVLLDEGWDPVDALDAILTARPVAAIAYARSAVRWHHDRLGSPDHVLDRDLERVEEWFTRNGVDAARSIGRIRRSG
jgi:hypothetical protein